MKEQWVKLGYSEKDSDELEKLSKIGSDMRNVNIEETVDSLVDVMKKYDIDPDDRITKLLNEIPN